MENNSVNVYLRVRPKQIWEASSPAKSYIDYENSTNEMLILETNPFAFDHVFYSDSKQNDVFQKIRPSVDNLLRAFNSCVFAYGQSGSGKTFTMGLNEKNNGMITLSLDYLFTRLDSLENVEFDISVSFIEIYNEKVYDLLDDKNTDSIHTKGSKYAGSTKVPILISGDAKEIMAKANKNRHVRSTMMNASSSRSHAMFSIFLNMRTANKKIGSVLHLVDLAGSEGLRNTGHKGIAQQEGIHINQGLLAVGKVIQALSSGKKLVPYRDSILTTVLQDCLNPDAFLTLIGCVSPARKDRNETLSTIRFAQSCKALESKMIPEMNAYLKQKQRLQARTPLKSYMLEQKRNEVPKTPGKTLSKTPAKVPSTMNRGTGTIRKQPSVSSINRFRSFTTPSKRNTAADPMRFSEFPKASDMSYMNPTPKQSIDNNTFSVLNFSSSTEVDGPPSSAHPSLINLTQASVPSFSPLMRQIEATIEKKLTAFMTSFMSQTTTSANNDKIAENLRNDIKDAVVSGINEMRDLSGVDDSSDLNNSFIEVHENAVSSTVLRRPDIPDIQINDEPLPAHEKRANRRLMTFDFDEHAPKNSQNLSSQNLTVIHAPRRSVRISMMHDIRKTKENVMPAIMSKARKTNIKNKTMAAYWNDSTSSGKLKVSKGDHKVAVMDMINTGSIKELQMLPTIGPKTAYQIVSHRLVKGNFKVLEDVKKALMMKEKSWNNFMEKNLLK